MRRTTTLLGAAALFVGALTVAADDKNPTRPFDDAEFAMKAASGGLHEVELGKLAVGRAKNDDVKKFAQLMVDDHTKANEALKAAAKSANVPLPDKMNAEHQAEYDRFKAYAGADFDLQYVKHMVKDHEEDVAAFTRAAKEARNPLIKQFAADALPTLQDHLKAVKALQDRAK